MEIKDVKVWSGVNATVGLTAPTVNLRKTWEKKGSFQKIPFDALQQAMYEPGVDFLFKTGALYIKEKEINIALGLIDEDEPEAVAFVLDDATAKELLTKTPLKAYRETLEKLSHIQLIDLAATAVDLRVQDFQRCKAIQDKTGIEVFKKVTEAVEEDSAKTQQG